MAQSEYHYAYYRENKHRYRSSKDARVLRNQEYVWLYLVAHPCVDCGEADPVVLEFDHLDDKKKGIATMVGQGLALKTIAAEIAKCVVRCCNCHRRKTMVSLNWWRSTKETPRNSTG